MKKVVILLGMPGSGKGTQGKILSEILKISHISTGDIFRNMVKKETQESKTIVNYMKSGKLLPTDIVNKVVKDYFDSNILEFCVLDGYPRTIEQMKFFITNVTSKIHIIFFDISEEIAKKRILSRLSCSICGNIYNNIFDKPEEDTKCNYCQVNSLEKRLDDNNDTIEKRFSEYKKNTLPIVEYCKKMNSFYKVFAEESKDKVKDQISLIAKKI